MNILRKFYIKANPKSMEQSKKALILFGAFLLLLILVVVSICIGAVAIPFSNLLDILKSTDISIKDTQIICFVRLPRTLAALLAGMALSVAGTILQTVLNNLMCSPNIIGVNSGAGLFMIIVTALFPHLLYLAPAAAFLGALVAVLVVYGIAKKTGASRISIVLAGIAVSSLLGAFTDTIITLVPDAKVSRVDFLIGSFSGVTMENIKFSVCYIIFSILITMLLSYDINILALGDSTATSLGLKTRKLRMLLLIISALLAGSAISLAGLIGFVGLIVPHISKLIIGYDHRFLVPLSALLGGVFCLGCDIMARTLFAPFEIPVGIVMSMIGSPFFIYLILSRKRRAVFD